MFLSTLLPWAIVLVVLVYLLKYIKSNAKLVQILHKLPGPPEANFFFGNILPFYTGRDQIFQLIKKYSSDYYPIFKVWMAHVTHANIVSPEDFELVMTNVKHNQKSVLYNFLHSWLRTGLLTSKGEKWQARRKILTPAFHFSILQGFISIFNEETSNLVDVLKQECDKPYVNVNQHVEHFTLKTIGETSMGTKFEFKTKAQIEYKLAIFRIARLYLYRVFRPWLSHDFVYYLTPAYWKERSLVNTLHKFTNTVIVEREKNFNALELSKNNNELGEESYSSKKRLAMLDLLLSVKINEGLIDDQGIREEVDTFMFEGHDTTAVAICYAMMLIANHKDVQDQLVQEMRDVLGDIKKKPTYQDLQDLKYMERCLKEVLRLYPSVYYISRQLGEDMVSNDGYLLPKGTAIHMHIYALHHNPNIYPDPERFDPDRFLPENSQKRHPFAYVPFSAGPRNCIGQRFAMLELKAVLCGVLANFVLEPIDTPSSIVLVVDLVLRTKEGIKVKFVPRLE